MSIQEWHSSPTQETQLGDTAESAMGGGMEPVAPRPSTDFQKWATGDQSDGKLGASMQQARRQNPDLRAEVFNLQGKTGLPAELIQRNIDVVRERVAAKDFDPKRFRQEFPKLAGAMEDPETAALAHDDLDSLQLLERTLSGFKGLDERELRFQVEGRTGRRPGDFGADPRQLQDALNAEEIDLAEFQERFPQFSEALTNDGESADSLKRRDAAFNSLARTNESERFREMGTLEWFLEAPVANYRKGLRGEELNDLYYQQMASGSSPEQQARIAALEQELDRQPDVGGRGLFTDMVASASEIAPSLVGGIQAGAETGIPAAIGAGTTAFALGQAGPQIASPEEIFTVPAATLAGLSVGGATGYAQYAYQQEAGSAFAEFSQFRDEDGTPIDRDTAAVAASLTGAIGAGLESLGFGALVKTFPGGEKVLGAFSRDTMKAALRNPTVRQAFSDLAKRYGTAWGTETMTEVMQEGVTIIGGELAKAWDPNDFEGLGAEEVGQRLTDTFVQVAQGMALLSAPGPVSSFAMDYGRARNARQTSEAMEALGEGARASKLRERLPNKYREVVAKLREDGPIQNVQIPVERWNELFQSQQLDPAQVASEVIGNYDAYSEAMATGGDVVIPVEAYAEKLAGGDFHDFLSQNSRFRPGDMTPREAQEWIDSAPDQVASYLAESNQPDPSAAVYDDVYGQLVAAGRERSTADQEARITQAVFRSLGERIGQDPAELFRQYNVSVTRPMPEVLQRAGGNLDTDIDPLIDRLRAGDIPTQRDAFGQSLLDFLRERGVRDEGGELAARDIDVGRKAFQRVIARDDGMGLDDAAQAAAEAGYLRGFDRENVTQNDLFDAIDREMRDGPVFSDLDGDAQVQQLRDTLNDLGDYLENLGVDIESMDNNAIKQLLNGEQAAQVVDGEAATTLDQSGRQPRGRITFPQSRRFFNIELLEGADLSTFLHESGHLYLEVIRDLAQRDGAPQQVRDDFQAVLDWMGVADADSIGTEQHEQWARGFEAYIMEGNAPSADLRDVFARFKAWLVAIYRSIQNLNVELTDEVRGVMDRLVATDEEISSARDEAGYRPLFNDAAAAGMTDAEYQAYRESAQQARTEAEDSLTRRVMREFKREVTDWWKEAMLQVLEQVSGEVNQRPEYVAMSVMGRGKLPDGSALPEGMEPFKINRAALVDRYGKEFLKRLPRPYVYSREGGIHPDMAAEMFGYRSGDEMVQAMINARPRKQLIDAEVDARMKERYGDMLNDGSMADAAMQSVHNDKRAEVMQRELRALASRSRRPASPMSAIKSAAQRIVAEKQVRNLRPDLYLRAEQKASREAFNAVAEGDYARATEAKQRQLLNHELYREARNARQDVDKLVDYTARLNRKPTRQRLARAGADYLAQIDSLLERYEFKRATSLRRIDRRQSLDAWIAEQNEQGFTVDVPESVANDARVISYKQVTVEELRGIRDALRQIEHLARTKNRLLAAQSQRDFEATVDSVVSTIESSHNRVDKPVPLHESLKDRMASWASQAHAWHTKPEFLFRWLDGDRETGPVWRAMFKPLADAETAEQTMQADVTKRLAKIMSAYTRKERAGWYGEKHYIPAIGRSMDKARMIGIALNWGNAYNREVLMEGHGWSDTQVQAILSRLEARDWLVVQEIWDLIDSFWPDIQAMEKDLNGLAPEKVAAAQVETPAGTLRGGYYPIKYDTRVSYRAFQREEKAGDSMFENSYTKPATRNGHTKERQGSGGQQLRLDLDVLSEHIGQVIHDITHRRAVIDVNRLSQNADVRSAIEQTAGREMYRQIRPWLQSIANETLQPESYWEKLIGQARTGATVVNMGLKATTAIVQPLGFFNSVDILGERYAWKGLTDFLGSRGRSTNPWSNMKRATSFVQERSVMMQNRQKTFDRDVRDSLQRLTKESRLQEWQRSFFYFTGLMDQAVVIPTWLGAYRKAMEGEVAEIEMGHERNAIDYADSIVRQSQSSGGVKDLAQIQRGGQVRRSFVMFYSYFSALYNQFSRQISRVKRGDISLPRLAASAMYLWFVPAVLGELIAQRGPDDEEEWAEWAATQGILYPLGTVVGLRDVGSAVLTPFGYDASPAFDAFSMTARTAKIPLKALDDEQEVGRADVKAAVLTAGYWGKLPSRQAWITGEYLYDVATGEDSPDSPQEFVRNLFFSRPADER